MKYYLSIMVHLKNGNSLKCYTRSDEDKQVSIKEMEITFNNFNTIKQKGGGTIWFTPDESTTTVIDVNEIAALELNILTQISLP